MGPLAMKLAGQVYLPVQHFNPVKPEPNAGAVRIHYMFYLLYKKLRIKLKIRRRTRKGTFSNLQPANY